MKFLKNKTIMITGGTGSFGQAFTKFLLECDAKKIIITDTPPGYYEKEKNKKLKIKKMIIEHENE
jgi:UDP-N-acetylglucosamine 4,6-dehydratase